MVCNKSIYILFLCYSCYRKRYLKVPSQFKHSRNFTSGNNKRSIKEQITLDEKKIVELIIADQMDKPTTRKIAYCEGLYMYAV